MEATPSAVAIGTGLGISLFLIAFMLYQPRTDSKISPSTVNKTHQLGMTRVAPTISNQILKAPILKVRWAKPTPEQWGTVVIGVVSLTLAGMCYMNSYLARWRVRPIPLVANPHPAASGAPGGPEWSPLRPEGVPRLRVDISPRT